MSTPAKRKVTATPARLRRPAHNSNSVSAARESSLSSSHGRVPLISSSHAADATTPSTAAAAAAPPASPARASSHARKTTTRQRAAATAAVVATTSMRATTPQRPVGTTAGRAVMADSVQRTPQRATAMTAGAATVDRRVGGSSNNSSKPRANTAAAAMSAVRDKRHGHPAAPLPVHTTTRAPSSRSGITTTSTMMTMMTSNTPHSGVVANAASALSYTHVPHADAPSLSRSGGVAAAALLRREQSVASTSYSAVMTLASNNNNKGTGDVTAGDGAAVSLGEDVCAASCYRVAYTLQSTLCCVAVAARTATVWAGNGVDGNLYLYNALTGELAHTLLPPATAGATGAATATPRSSKTAASRSHAATPRAVHTATGTVARPCALRATATHMWVGYDTGMVAVYDVLVLRRVTRGAFHAARITDFAIVHSGGSNNNNDDDGDEEDVRTRFAVVDADATVRGVGSGDGDVATAVVVSAAHDGTLALWDCAAHGYECVVALTATPFALRNDGALTCIHALPLSSSLSSAAAAAATAARRRTHERKANNKGVYSSNDDDDDDDTAAAAAVTTTPSALLLCGYETGTVAVVLLTAVDACVCVQLRNVHTQRVNALTVAGASAFSAAEDGTVCVWRCAQLTQTALAVAASSSSSPLASNRYSSSDATVTASCLLRRVPVRPSVRALLSCVRRGGGGAAAAAATAAAAYAPHSLWVAYADGLVERWSAHVEDGFAVEEVVRAAALHTCPAHSDDDEEEKNGDEDDKASVAGDTAMSRDENSAVAHDEDGKKANAVALTTTTPRRSQRRHAATATTTTRARTATTTTLSAAHARGVLSLCALGTTDTLRVLALSSSGVNTVWYTHHNAVEQRLQHSIAQLYRVIACDVDEAAAWRERVALLLQKETERKVKYAVLLAQLHELQLLWRYCETWRRRVVAVARPRRGGAVVARELAASAQHALRARYYRVWVCVYATRQRRRAQHQLAAVLARASRRVHARSVLARWQAARAHACVMQQLHACVDVLARTAQVVVLTRYYDAWRRHAQRQSTSSSSSAAVSLLTAEQLQLLASKAQRQTLRRALHAWHAAYTSSLLPTRRQRTAAATAAAAAVAVDERASEGGGRGDGRAMTCYAPVVLQRFAAVCARDNNRRHAAVTWQRWRAWARRHRRVRVLHAVATLQAEQCAHAQRHETLLRWLQFVRARQLARCAAAMQDVTQRVRELELQHGDVFDRLQLQRQVERLREQHAQATAQLHDAEARVRALQTSRDALRHRNKDKQQQEQQQLDEEGKQKQQSSSSSSPLAASSAVLGGSTTAAATAAMATAAAAAGAQEAAWYAYLIEQQHLSPVVLQHLTLAEAMPHVVAQLKGNVLNLYTDLPLLRALADRRRGGTTAMALFTEAFAEVKRAVVTVLHTPLMLLAAGGGEAAGGLRGGDSRHAAHVAVVQPGLMAARWPLSLAAVDSVPLHLCASALSAIKTLLIAYDLLTRDELDAVTATSTEVVANADWLLLLARACHLRRRPTLPANNRSLIAMPWAIIVATLLPLCVLVVMRLLTSTGQQQQPQYALNTMTQCLLFAFACSCASTLLFVCALRSHRTLLDMVCASLPSCSDEGVKCGDAAADVTDKVVRRATRRMRVCIALALCYTIASMLSVGAAVVAWMR